MKPEIDEKAEPFLKKEKLCFDFLPGYARFLLDKRLLQLVTYGLQMAREADFHLMKYFDFMDDEKLVELAKISNTVFLTAIIENNLDEYIRVSTEKWKANRLPLIARDQIVAEDIALTSFLRKKGFQKFIADYTTDIQLCVNIMQELDRMILVQQMAGFKTFIDIQQEKLNELNQSLQKNEVLLLEAQQRANVGSFDWDLVGTDSSFTPQLFRIFEIDAPIKFDAFLEWVHNEDKRKLENSIVMAMKGDGIFESEYRYNKTSNEKLIWSRGIVSSIDGKPYRMRGTVMDITEKHKIIKQLADLNYSLEQKNIELERSNKELTSFGYVASHDLQEPLRNIKIFVNIILDRESTNLSEKGAQLLGRVSAATERMQKLIEDLLTFSQTRALPGEFTSVDLNHVVNEMKNLHSEAIREKQISVTATKLPIVRAIAFQVNQLLDNLFTNAVKYCKEGMPLTIYVNSEIVNGQRLLQEGGDANLNYYRISFSDNGIGFEQKYAHKIFDIFQRLHGKDEYSGTGIGLAICKKIVQNHNGIIYATGVPDEGATIYICLPVS